MRRERRSMARRSIVSTESDGTNLFSTIAVLVDGSGDDNNNNRKRTDGNNERDDEIRYDAFRDRSAIGRCTNDDDDDDHDDDVDRRNSSSRFVFESTVFAPFPVSSVELDRIDCRSSCSSRCCELNSLSRKCAVLVRIFGRYCNRVDRSLEDRVNRFRFRCRRRRRCRGR